jgi:tRNA(Ile)-lysidine synthase TilS/MesJ
MAACGVAEDAEEDAPEARRGGGAAAEDERSAAALPRKRPAGVRPQCLKCKAAPAVALVLEPACAECFRERANRKFRAALGELGLAQGERVLLALSGGHGSAALLDLVARVLAFDQSQRRPPRIEPVVVHVDEADVLRMAPDEQRAATRELEALCEQTGGFALRVLPLLATHARAREWIDAARSPTDREDLLQLLRDDALARFAVEQGLRWVLRGDTASRLAHAVLAHTSKGRGLAVATALSAEGQRLTHVALPMQGFLAKEVAFYCHLCRLPAVFRPCFCTMAGDGPRAGVNVLAESFLVGLQTRFDNTVFNVVRTAQKLQVPPEARRRELARCRLCRQRIPPDDWPDEALSAPAAAAPAGAPAAGPAAPRRLCYACSVLLSEAAAEGLPRPPSPPRDDGGADDE